MKLIQFNLDLPYLGNESILQDYDTKGKWVRRTFENQTRCVCAFFARLLGQYNTNDTRKLIIECVPTIQDERVRTALNISWVEIQFDYNCFVGLDDLGKKKIALETLMQGIRKVAEEKKWDITPFESVYAKIVKAGYVNEWIWKKPVKSPGRKHSAYIFLRHEVKQIDIFIVICDKEGKEIKRQKIITEVPNEWDYALHLGEIKWLDDKTIVLLNQKKYKGVIIEGKDKEWAISL